jgi:PIN domain nuclease of toxin-antitoxin system
MGGLPRVPSGVRLLLDSHAFLWAASGDDRLPPSVADLIGDMRNRIVLSVATTWELTLKVERGRLRLPAPPQDYFEDRVEALTLELLPIHQRHVAALAELPQLHADPFDRMLVAQALVEDMDLVTGDRAVHEYPVRTIW